jgi:hypothetical protein
MGREIAPSRRPVPVPDQPWLRRKAWPSRGITSQKYAYSDHSEIEYDRQIPRVKGQFAAATELLSPPPANPPRLLFFPLAPHVSGLRSALLFLHR